MVNVYWDDVSNRCSGTVTFETTRDAGEFATRMASLSVAVVVAAA